MSNEISQNSVTKANVRAIISDKYRKNHDKIFKKYDRSNTKRSRGRSSNKVK